MDRPQLTQEIIAAIGPNADNRITGTVLRDILLKVVDGTQLNIIGMAYTDTVPDESYDATFAPVYIAAGTGTYTNFEAIELTNELALLRLTDDGWVKDTVVYLDEIEFPQVAEGLESIEEAKQNAITDIAAIQKITILEKLQGDIDIEALNIDLDIQELFIDINL